MINRSNPYIILFNTIISRSSSNIIQFNNIIYRPNLNIKGVGEGVVQWTKARHPNSPRNELTLSIEGGRLPATNSKGTPAPRATDAGAISGKSSAAKNSPSLQFLESKYRSRIATPPGGGDGRVGENSIAKRATSLF
ncbi:hypothetical protein CDAR_251381 [Caerostris darwini]|uniref:Uncharacterized protein n=1 Tax=Caerostris darwini TaxID=1538125 RepID=A0AAV4R614_9ARAC|nr:hypothetical protein CDAR_251381 [Caerostris darwini]